MRNYRILTMLIAPLLPLWLFIRRLRGKEDRLRFRERFGIASQPRPPGTLLWLHAASVGEANSVLPFIFKMRAHYPHINLLLTTGTVTSAALMQKRLPKDVIHQYAPIDTPKATDRFIWHWRPDFAFWVESEFWPNLIWTANDFGSFMGVINARMSERSFASWQKRPAMIHDMLSCFNLVFAQSVQDGARLKSLGAKHMSCCGNIKYDAATLPCNEDELIAFKNTIGNRPLWLAASTHPGEELLIAEAHKLLSATRKNLLTIIVPRHPARGSSIATELQTFGKIALRSKQESITTDTKFYIADTLGELGLFYRASDIVFMGGSLVNHGGQNPLEPAKLSCAVLTGPHTHNFSDIYAEMEKAGVVIRVQNAAGLAAQIDKLLNDAKAREAMQNAVRFWMQDKGGATDRLLENLQPIFEVRQP